MIAVAALYAVAFFAELFRFIRQRANLPCVVDFAVDLAIIGLVSHTVYLSFLHLFSPYPVGGAPMFFFASAWGIVLVYIIWKYFYPTIPFGLILLPLAFLLMIGGIRLMSLSTAAATNGTLPGRSIAKMFHAAPAAGIMVALSIASVCCLCYFLESYFLHKKRSLPPPIQLPSLEWSLSVCRTSSMIVVGCLSLCVLGGIILNINRHVTSVWHDPLVIGALCLIVVLFLGPLKWLFQFRPATESRFVFMLIVFAYIVFLFVLVIALATGNAHWNKA